MTTENITDLLSSETKAAIDVWVAKYPADKKRSALLPALHIAQDQNQGYLTDPLLEAVATYLSLPAAYAYEVATFYSMYELKPVGRHKVYICNSISCMLRGSDPLIAHATKKLGIQLGETTADGKITLRSVECLAACGGAPAMMLDKEYHENLTPEKLDALLDALE